MGKNSAIILAAGKGRRMGEDINKQYLNIKGITRFVLYFKSFSESNDIDEIIVVVAEG